MNHEIVFDLFLILLLYFLQEHACQFVLAAHYNHDHLPVIALLKLENFPFKKRKLAPNSKALRANAALSSCASTVFPSRLFCNGAR